MRAIGSPLDRLLVQVNMPIVAATRPVASAETETLVPKRPSPPAVSTIAPTIAPKRMSVIRDHVASVHVVDATLGALAEDVRIAATLLGWIDEHGLTAAGTRLLAVRDPEEESIALAVALLENPPLSAIASALLLGEWLELRELAPALERALGLAPVRAHWLAPCLLGWRDELRERGWAAKRVVEHLRRRTAWMNGLSPRGRDVLARLGIVEQHALLAFEWAELRELQHVRPETIREIERFRIQLQRARDRPAPKEPASPSDLSPRPSRPGAPSPRPSGPDRPVKAARPALAAVLTTARKLVEHGGCASIAALSRACAPDGGAAPDLAVVRRVLAVDPAVRWLDEDIGWFWIPDIARNRVLARLDKILAVAGEIDLMELREAIARDRAMEGDVPPAPVLAALCDQLGDCELVDGGTRVRDTRPRDESDVLSAVEQGIVAVFRAHGGVAFGSDATRELAEAGVAERTVAAALVNSPLLRRLGRGRYALVGAVDPTVDLDGDTTVAELARVAGLTIEAVVALVMGRA